MLKTILNFKRGDFEKEINKLSKLQKKIYNDFFSYCLISAKEQKVKDMGRNILKFKLTCEKDFNKIDLKNLRDFLVILNNSELSDYAKNDIKVHIKKLLKWLFDDWSLRFKNFDDVKQESNPLKKREINSKIILTPQELKELIDFEQRIFYKAFLMVQYEVALRTKEVRFLKWGDIDFNTDGDISEINMFSTKTKTRKTLPIHRATALLLELREQQEKSNTKGIYVFHSKADVNKPIDKATISVWLRDLSKKAIGREIWAYILRHTRGTELRVLVNEGKISLDTALQLMGHSEKMFKKTYSHVDKKRASDIIKTQLYKKKIYTQEEKDEIKELRKQVENQGKEIKKLKEISNQKEAVSKSFLSSKEFDKILQEKFKSKGFVKEIKKFRD